MASVSMIAPRPATLRMARVLPPLAAASLRQRDISRGVSRDPAARRAPHGFRRWPEPGRHRAPVPIRPPARSTLTASRAARTADHRLGDAHAGDRALELRPVDHVAQRAADIGGEIRRRAARSCAPPWRARPRRAPAPPRRRLHRWRRSGRARRRQGRAPARPPARRWPSAMPSRTASRISPNTNRSPIAVPASPAHLSARR